MGQWTDTELDALGTASELKIASRRRDATLTPPVTIWAVRHDDVYVRSVNGPSATWYRAAKVAEEQPPRAATSQLCV